MDALIQIIALMLTRDSDLLYEFVTKNIENFAIYTSVFVK
ncbi:hypothetical protein PPHE_a3908 [Pseudoalteromonas phenolica O-BC30]|nr:hypothetical protein [Pseudoalteromonas phenolica O-BC30]